MKNHAHTILTFHLSKEERSIVRHRVSDLTAETVDVRAAERDIWNNTSIRQTICLAVCKTGEDHKKNCHTIRRIRNLIGESRPLIVVIKQDHIRKLKDFIKAGADDFITSPMTMDRFRPVFSFLLEMNITAGEATATPGDKSDIQRGSRRLLRRKPLGQKWLPRKKLGKGGWNTVWLVEDINSGRLAVAKVPCSRLLNIRILRTAAIMKKLGHHRNIAALLELVKHNGKFVLIQEYVPGLSLTDILKQPLSQGEKESYLMQLLHGVSHCHKYAILHRDIKPDNIIITGTGVLKLLDFGIARDLSWQSTSNSSEGTVEYMPPEQLEGISCIQSDIWSIGVILHIFATGTLPCCHLSGGHPSDILSASSITRPSELNPLISEWLQQVIMTCLQRDPNRRYGNGQVLLDELAAFYPVIKQAEQFPRAGYGLLPSLSAVVQNTRPKTRRIPGLAGISPPFSFLAQLKHAVSFAIPRRQP
ncbi:serine/threonine protein kinase [Desulforhopalus singaporensis]|uniref:Serine/threonine protein kinase n=1 Tax=Desulforhopalus singaporensis TaxID=91360 RepID=A0A1H0K1N4_9BACT|nr:serine/threonine-protein kinase [Desulforhopalus singaporensis]SDO49877.1 Serine/threonine protein kinase [Desulforhopalus singaporensis]